MNLDELITGVSGAELVSIPQVGHCLHVECPQVFLEVINAFFDKKKLKQEYISDLLTTWVTKTVISQPVNLSSKQKYIFSSGSEYEKERLKRLNKVYNPITCEMLSPHLRAGMNIMEIGPGNGELGSWMVQFAGKDTKYTAVESGEEALVEVAKNIPTAELIHASILEIDQVTQLEGRKFDLIYFRWVLAYTAQEKFLETLKKIYNLLALQGLLICEECNVYKVYCADRQTNYAKISYSPIDKWLKLSEDVDRKFSANFGLGKLLKKLLICTTGDEQKVEVRKYQPLLKDQYTKSILFFGMKSSGTAFIEAGIRQPLELDSLTHELKVLADDQNLGVYYVKNSVGLVRK